MSLTLVDGNRSTKVVIPSCDLIRASTQAEKLIGFLSDKRDDAVFFTTIWDTTETLADIRTRLKHRLAQRQTHRSNTPASTPFEYWRLNLFLPLIDISHQSASGQIEYTTSTFKGTLFDAYQATSAHR